MFTATAGATGDSITKKITKTYTNIKNEALRINNEYGNVEIKTWNKKGIQIDITVLAHAKTMAGAKQLTASVSITDKRNDGVITCNTNIGETSKTTRLNDSLPEEKCTINYVVYLPSETPLKIQNQFGSIIMGDYTGHLEIKGEFGDFTAGNIKSLDSLIIVQGSISIRNIFKGELLAKGFGSIKIDTVSGDVHCGFALGNTLDVGLIKGQYNFVLNSNNIKAITFHCAKELSTNVSVDAILSKFINQSSLVMNEQPDTIQRKQPVKKPDLLLHKPNNDTSRLLFKKMQALNLPKKHAHYYSKAGQGSATININVAFSFLKFK